MCKRKTLNIFWGGGYTPSPDPTPSRPLVWPTSFSSTPHFPRPSAAYAYSQTLGYIHSINIGRFIRDIISSRLITHPPSNLSDLIDCYNSTLTNLLNKHAPLKSKTIRSKPPKPWFTPALNKLKSAKRRLERAWSKSHSSEDLKLLRSATNHYHACCHKS